MERREIKGKGEGRVDRTGKNSSVQMIPLPACRIIQSTVHCIALHCSAVQYSTVQHSTAQLSRSYLADGSAYRDNGNSISEGE